VAFALQWCPLCSGTRPAVSYAVPLLRHGCAELATGTAYDTAGQAYIWKADQWLNAQSPLTNWGNIQISKNPKNGACQVRVGCVVMNIRK